MSERRSPVQWALWNRRNLAITLTGGTALLLGFGACSAASADFVPESTPRATAVVGTPTLPPVVTPTPSIEATPTPTPTPETATATGETPAHVHDEDAPLDPFITVAAEGFVGEWLDTSDPRWPGDVDKFAVPTLVEALSLTNPADVPIGRVYDSEIVTSGLGYAEVLVLIDDEGTTVTTVLTDTADGWKVTEILP